jgi:hypothetical protein
MRPQDIGSAADQDGNGWETLVPRRRQGAAARTRCRRRLQGYTAGRRGLRTAPLNRAEAAMRERRRDVWPLA